MKFVAFVGIIFVCATAFADDFTLLNGKEYRNVTVSRVEPDGLVVTTAYGVVKLFFAELPSDMQKKYHYDPRAAEAFRFRLDAARDAAREEVSNADHRAREKTIRPPVVSPKDEFRAIKSLSLEAHEIGTADGFQSHWETDWGSYDREYARGKRILVTIHDVSRKVPKCRIDAYFIARPLFRPNARFIYDHRRLFPELRGRLEVKGPVAARDLPARMINLAALGRRYGRGADMDGWIVIGRAEGQVFGMTASSRTLFEIAQGNSRGDKTLADLIERYSDLERPH